jgi:hypothetical protein
MEKGRGQKAEGRREGIYIHAFCQNGYNKSEFIRGKDRKIYAEIACNQRIFAS